MVTTTGSMVTTEVKEEGLTITALITKIMTVAEETTTGVNTAITTITATGINTTITVTSTTSKAVLEEVMAITNEVTTNNLIYI